MAQVLHSRAWIEAFECLECNCAPKTHEMVPAGATVKASEGVGALVQEQLQRHSHHVSIFCIRFIPFDLISVSGWTCFNTCSARDAEAVWG